MEIISDCKQGSPRWFELRNGSIGGSSIASAVAGGQGKIRLQLMYRMAGEILTGEPYQSYQNDNMLRGISQEPEARDVYAMVKEVEVEQVGLVKESAHKHFSPDGLVSNGIIEIKSVIPSVHIETILHNEIPAAYRRQCNWGLHICQREYVDFVSYSPLITDNPILIIRRGRDEKLIKELDEGADKFIHELAQVIRKVKEAF